MAPTGPRKARPDDKLRAVPTTSDEPNALAPHRLASQLNWQSMMLRRSMSGVSQEEQTMIIFVGGKVKAPKKSAKAASKKKPKPSRKPPASKQR